MQKNNLATQIKYRYLPIFLHITIWATLMGIPLVFSEYKNLEPTQPPSSKALFAFNLVLCLFFYLNYLISIPQLFFKNKKKQYFIVIFLGWAVYIGISYWIISFLMQEIGQRQVPLAAAIFPYALIIAMSLTLRLLQERNQKEKEIAERETENLKSELSFLRSQVSPHFLFNVMNNVVSLARLQPQKVELTLIKLSSLMRYMLYESDDKKVEIRKEIDYLQAYIDLQDLRFGDDVKVVFQYDIQENILIETMLFIPFVENAFKHGVGLIPSPEINIFIKNDNNTLIFKCLNKYKNNLNDSKDDASGIGLKNVQRRLALLYPENHVLNVVEKGDYFKVELTIKINIQ